MTLNKPPFLSSLTTFCYSYRKVSTIHQYSSNIFVFKFHLSAFTPKEILIYLLLLYHCYWNIVYMEQNHYWSLESGPGVSHRIAREATQPYCSKVAVLFRLKRDTLSKLTVAHERVLKFTINISRSWNVSTVVKSFYNPTSIAQGCQSHPIIFSMHSIHIFYYSHPVDVIASHCAPHFLFTYY